MVPMTGKVGLVAAVATLAATGPAAAAPVCGAPLSTPAGAIPVTTYAELRDGLAALQSGDAATFYLSGSGPFASTSITCRPARVRGCGCARRRERHDRSETAVISRSPTRAAPPRSLGMPGLRCLRLRRSRSTTAPPTPSLTRVRSPCKAVRGPGPTPARSFGSGGSGAGNRRHGRTDSRNGHRETVGRITATEPRASQAVGRRDRRRRTARQLGRHTGMKAAPSW